MTFYSVFHGVIGPLGNPPSLGPWGGANADAEGAGHRIALPYAIHTCSTLI
jgi:hypothetical protein